MALDGDTSKHIVQVLRMQNGGQLQLTDGKGNVFMAEIIDTYKKNCALKINSTVFQPPSTKKATIAISLIKNVHRFEWFLEKATEIGVNEIMPLICNRTEKQYFRVERMKSILISAMLQSQQCWLPILHEPVKYAAYIKNINESAGLQKFIAHCEKDEPRVQLFNHKPFSSSIVLIGPEGEFYH